MAIDTKETALRARKNGVAILAFNIPLLPMFKAVVAAIKDENSVAMIEMARVEWENSARRALRQLRKNIENMRTERAQC